MQETTSCPSLTKSGKPRKRRGRPPKASRPQDAPNAPPQPRVTRDRHRDQQVLLWLINHRVEDTGGQDAAAGFEAHPRKMPDGSDKWFRGPTLTEASIFFHTPLATVAHWWDTKEDIFGGAVPASDPPLVRQRHRHHHHPWKLNNNNNHPPPPPSAAGVGPTVYPQAVQPAGPPMHPLYRANFALGEVSREVAHMLQDQQNIYLETLLRAIAMAQALVNDLTETHKVVLDPQSYPQYYPSGATPQQAYYAPLAPPPVEAYAPPQPPPPRAQRTPRQRQQQAYYAPLAPRPVEAHARPQPPPPPAQRTRRQRQQQVHHHHHPPQTGQQAGQSTWLIGNGTAGAFTAWPPSPARQPPQAAGAVVPQRREETASGRKRSYASKDGPGATADQPIKLEDDDVSVGEREDAAGRAKRKNISGDAGERGETAVAKDSAESQTVNDSKGEQGDPEGSVPQKGGGDETSTTQHVGTGSNADSGKQIAALSLDQPGAARSTQEPEAGASENPGGAAGAGKDDEVVQDGSGVLESQAADGDGIVQETENDIHNDASPDTATERGSETDSKGSLFADLEASSATANESGAEENTAAAQTSKGKAAAGELEEGEETKLEDAEMKDASVQDNSTRDSDELSPPSVSG